MKVKILIIVQVLLFSSLSYSQYLRVPETIQEQDQWCWAATSSCVLNYYGKNIPQCMCAEYTRQVATWHNFGTINCCVDPGQGCNYWNYNWGNPGSIQDILAHWGVSNSGVSSALNLPTCQTEINAQRPFIFRWGWTTGGGHFLVGHGVITSSGILYYMDPWFGEGLHIADYSWVVQGDNHTWTHTNVMTTNPILPSVPVLCSPENHSQNQSTSLTLIWRKCDRVLNYKLQIALDSMFTYIVFSDSTLSDTIKTVSGLTVSTTHWWRVCGKNSTGNSYYSNVWNFKTSITGIKPIGNTVPKFFRLYENYPNPFNPTTKIKFSLPFPSKGGVRLEVFDVLGRQVASLIPPLWGGQEGLSAGTYEVTFDGSSLSSGLYFYKLSATGGAGDFTDVKKMVFVK